FGRHGLVRSSEIKISRKIQGAPCDIQTSGIAPRTVEREYGKGLVDCVKIPLDKRYAIPIGAIGARGLRKYQVVGQRYPTAGLVDAYIGHTCHISIGGQRSGIAPHEFHL